METRARSAEGTAYAVLDGGGALTFVRSDDAREFGNGDRVDAIADVMGNVYEGVAVMTRVEDEAGMAMPPDLRDAVTSVRVAPGQAVAPRTCAGMFAWCRNLARADLAGMDVSGVASMRSMFLWCRSLASVDLTGWDTSGVTDASSMFWGCSSLAALDLSALDLAALEDARGAFGMCRSLSALWAPSSVAANDPDTRDMLVGCASLHAVAVVPSRRSSVGRHGTA